MRAIPTLGQGRDKMTIPGSETYGLLGKGARVLDLLKTPSGHLAIKVDDYGVAIGDHGSTAFTVTANLQCEYMPLLVME
eukprot:5729584-Pyramimonas_sp.AAC.1